MIRNIREQNIKYMKHNILYLKFLIIKGYYSIHIHTYIHIYTHIYIYFGIGEVFR